MEAPIPWMKYVKYSVIEVITKFLEKHPNFEKIELVGAENLDLSYEDKMLQIYPHHYQTDGFFICALQRKA